MSSNHNWLQLFLIYVNFAAVVTTILVILSALGIHYGFQEPIPYVLNNGTVHIDEVYPTPISPVKWMHITWLVVYGWMLAWSFHTLLATCRTFTGIPVYVNPTLVNIPMLMFSVAACGTTVTWYCVYDREYISTATLFSLTTTCLIWSAYGLSVYSIHAGLYRLEKGDRLHEAWLHRLLVQNGFALLGTWSFLVTVLNLCTSLIHNQEIRMDPDTAAVICLSIMSFFLVLVHILDVTILDKFTRYTCVHYVLPIVLFCACIFRRDEWPSTDVVFILLATLLAYSFLQIMIKAGCVSCRIMTASKDPADRSEAEGLTTGQSSVIAAFTPSGYLSEENYLFGK